MLGSNTQNTRWQSRFLKLIWFQNIFTLSRCLQVQSRAFHSTIPFNAMQWSSFHARIKFNISFFSSLSHSAHSAHSLSPSCSKFLVNDHLERVKCDCTWNPFFFLFLNLLLELLESNGMSFGQMLKRSAS